MLMVPTSGEGSKLKGQGKLRHLQHPGERSRTEGWSHSIPDPANQGQALPCSSGGRRNGQWTLFERAMLLPHTGLGALVLNILFWTSFLPKPELFTGDFQALRQPFGSIITRFAKDCIGRLQQSKVLKLGSHVVHMQVIITMSFFLSNRFFLRITIIKREKSYVPL